MFHSKEGLFFARNSDGSVSIIKTADRKFPAQDPSNIESTITLAENEWASVVCSVSKDGEDHARWMRARRFHGTDLPLSEHELKNAAQEELTAEQIEWMNAPTGPLTQTTNA